MLGLSLCNIFTHASRVLPHEIDCCNPITTLSVCSLHIIAAATEVNFLPRPISFGTSAPGISESQTHFLTMNPMAKTWCARNFVPGRFGIVYLWLRTQSSVDWWIGWVFSSIIASSRQLCSYLLLTILSEAFNTELVYFQLRTSSLSFAWSWTSILLMSVLLSSLTISFSCSDVSCLDGLRLRRSGNSSHC